MDGIYRMSLGVMVVSKIDDEPISNFTVDLEL